MTSRDLPAANLFARGFFRGCGLGAVIGGTAIVVFGAVSHDYFVLGFGAIAVAAGFPSWWVWRQ